MKRFLCIHFEYKRSRQVDALPSKGGEVWFTTFKMALSWSLKIETINLLQPIHQRRHFTRSLPPLIMEGELNVLSIRVCPRPLCPNQDVLTHMPLPISPNTNTIVHIPLPTYALAHIPSPYAPAHIPFPPKMSFYKEVTAAYIRICPCPYLLVRALTLPGIPGFPGIWGPNGYLLILFQKCTFFCRG